MVLESRSAEHRMRMTVDEAGEQHPPDFLNHGARVVVSEVRVRPDRPNSPALHQHGGVVQHLDGPELVATARPRGTATCDDLPCADEKGAQSPVSRMGRRIPCRRAVASASG